MKPFELHAWIKRRGLTHEQAANALRLSRHGLRKNLYGITPISEQTIRIVELLDQVDDLSSKKYSLKAHFSLA